MSVSLKRPVEQVDSPEGQEGHNRRLIGTMEPVPSFKARSDLGDTLRLWQLDTLHRRSKLDNCLNLEYSSPSNGLNTANELPQDDQGVARKVSGDVLCYGMIHKARLRVLDITSLSDKVSGCPIPSTNFYSLELEYRDRSYFLISNSAKSLAVLNDETTRALQIILKFSTCYFKAYFTQDEWKESVQSIRKNDKILYVLVDIVLYGPREDRNDVGDELSSNRIYLQHPYYQEADTLYDNPHVLKLDNLMTTSQFSDTLDLITTPKKGLSVSQSFSDLECEGDSPDAQVRRKIAAVFNSLTRSKNLKRIKANVRIRTPLKPYQEQALDFIDQRERGLIPSEYSLWSSGRHELEDFYEHKITGVKTSQPPSENGGGILADEMGLGKTLTVISAIIRTAGDAKSFAERKEGTPPENPDTSQHLASRSTLVVCPSPLLLQEWIDEIQMHCDGSLNVNVYHGRGRETDRSGLADSDIILSTYHTIAAEALDMNSPLYQIKWFRIVLDEAHIIRHMSTKLFRAVAKLHTNFRWCLTGTPVQNSLDDLVALMAFIRASPLDDHHEFRKHVIRPLIENTGMGPEGLRSLLDSVCLRRTRKLLHLPQETYERREVEFSSSERAHYAEAESQMAKAVKQHCSYTGNSKGYFGVFQLQLQLRQLCNHGTFQKPFSRAVAEEIPFDPDEAFALLQKSGNDKCRYCDARVTGLNGIEDVRSGHITVCGHLLCLGCVPRYKQALRQDPTGGNRQCSLCPQKITTDCFLTKKIMDKISSNCHIPAKEYFESSGTSSKVLALLNDIQQNLHRGKSIVFSGWTRSLDLVERHLAHLGINYLRMDGSYSLSRRREVLSRFNNDSSMQVLIMTTGTGGTGLNITIANIVYILEPQWNPTVEDQAIARVLRLGQTKEVKVMRYIMKGTVEELMRSQQTRKLEFAKAGWREEG